jgi:hypothetical protein
MKLENERPDEQYVKYDVELTAEERTTLLQYGKQHIDDDTLIEFAIVDIIKKQLEKI